MVTFTCWTMTALLLVLDFLADVAGLLLLDFLSGFTDLHSIHGFSLIKGCKTAVTQCLQTVQYLPLAEFICPGLLLGGRVTGAWCTFRGRQAICGSTADRTNCCATSRRHLQLAPQSMPQSRRTENSARRADFPETRGDQTRGV